MSRWTYVNHSHSTQNNPQTTVCNYEKGWLAYLRFNKYSKCVDNSSAKLTIS